MTGGHGFGAGATATGHGSNGSEPMLDPTPPPVWHRWLPQDRLDWMLIATAAMSEGLLVWAQGWLGGIAGLLVFAFFVVLAASR